MSQSLLFMTCPSGRLPKNGYSESFGGVKCGPRTNPSEIDDDSNHDPDYMKAHFTDTEST